LNNNISKNHLWINSKGNRVQAVNYQKTLQKYAKQAGLEGKITGHSLRRACATHMLKNGANPVQIQMLLGHATLKHLSQYLKLTITDLKAMHERSRLGK
jgi:integrase/recombinase XerD